MPCSSETAQHHNGGEPKTVSLTKKAIAIILAAVIAATVVTFVVADQLFATYIPTDGEILPINSALTPNIPQINWGGIPRGQSTSEIITVENNSTKQITNMTLSTIQNITTIGLTLTWNYTQTTLYPTQTIPLNFTLHVAPNATEGAFAFTIVITPELKPT